MVGDSTAFGFQGFSAFTQGLLIHGNNMSTTTLPLTSLLQHARRRVYFEGVNPHRIFCCTLSRRQQVFQGRSHGQALAVLFTLSLNNATLSQLDAIPTVGFSDPILSYFSALRFYFDGVRMFKDGYEKVICFSLDAPFLVSTR
jgi:hypothetical protein